GDLLIGCAPAHKPRTHPYRIDQSCRPGYTNDLASNCHATTVGGSARPPQGTNVTTCCLAGLWGGGQCAGQRSAIKTTVLQIINARTGAGLLSRGDRLQAPTAGRTDPANVPQPSGAVRPLSVGTLASTRRL